MAFTLPNVAVAGFPQQSEPDSTDIDILTAGHSMTGVVSGCAVTPQGSPNMTVAVASGTISVLGVNQAVASGNVTITAANGSNPRKDIVVSNSSGVKSVIAGTAAATPLKPAVPASNVCLAEVYVPAADTAIGATQITDKRVIVQAATSTQMHLIARKTSDQSVTSSTVHVNDTALVLPVGASSVWRAEWYILAEGTAGDISIGFSFPAGGRLSLYAATFTPAGVMTDWGTSSTTTPTGPVALSSLLTSPTNRPVIIDATFVNSTTAGNVTLMWSQNASSGTATTVKANSTLWGAQLV